MLALKLRLLRNSVCLGGGCKPHLLLAVLLLRALPVLLRHAIGAGAVPGHGGLGQTIGLLRLRLRRHPLGQVDLQQPARPVGMCHRLLAGEIAAGLRPLE
ncbi:hypothetical protein [Leisingera sp. F5]|uniref:hypothetical protein n=1 Tax=Leisingera sp. F5 TaxID=1813816 RepID=UPI0025BC02CE|nr:hypothetical protein [Leisingera sp. F5]